MPEPVSASSSPYTVAQVRIRDLGLKMSPLNPQVSAISSPYCSGQLKNLIILDLSNMSLNWKNSRIYGTDEEFKVHGIGKQPAQSWVSSHVPFGAKQCDEKASLSTVWKVEVGRGNSNQGTIMAFEKVSGSFYG